ncbi:hypothetical protein LSAT2_031470 [Lamellibrachia satsuma]|nr:hypothetical protein LSAT2_031470 [Lamellibrachia satsuma]
MEDLYRRVLREKRIIILDNLETKRVLDHMLQHRIFNEDDCDHVKEGRTRRECCQEFLDMLPRRGHQGYMVFLEALDHEQFKYLADILRNYEAELQKEELSRETSCDVTDSGFEERNSSNTPVDDPGYPVEVASYPVTHEVNCSTTPVPRQNDQRPVTSNVDVPGGSYRPGSGVNYSVLPASCGTGSPTNNNSHMYGSRTSHQNPQTSDDNYRPGSGTNYAVLPPTTKHVNFCPR